MFGKHIFGIHRSVIYVGISKQISRRNDIKIVHIMSEAMLATR